MLDLAAPDDYGNGQSQDNPKLAAKRLWIVPGVLVVTAMPAVLADGRRGGMRIGRGFGMAHAMMVAGILGVGIAVIIHRIC